MTILVSASNIVITPSGGRGRVYDLYPSYFISFTDYNL